MLKKFGHSYGPVSTVTQNENLQYMRSGRVEACFCYSSSSVVRKLDTEQEQKFTIPFLKVSISMATKL